MINNEDRDVLAHVVLDPDAWWRNAVESLGLEKAQEALFAKVNRWRKEYNAAVIERGASYKTRAQEESDIQQ